MRIRSLFVFGILVIVSTFAVCQESKVAVFGGWQFMNTGGSERQNIVAGWDADIAYKILPKVAVVGDFSGSYKTFDTVTINSISIKPNLHVHNFLFGPRVGTSIGKFSPFAEILLGVNRTSAGGSSSNVSASLTSSGFGMALGGGVDYKWRTPLSVRLVKFDYLRNDVDFSSSSLGISGLSKGLNHIRIATGLVLHF